MTAATCGVVLAVAGGSWVCILPSGHPTVEAHSDGRGNSWLYHPGDTPMTADLTGTDLLRAAAALMRHRARSAPDDCQLLWLHPDGTTHQEEKGHATAWTPAVALAVADLLDVQADQWLAQDPECVAAEAAARAYLGGNP